MVSVPPSIQPGVGPGSCAGSVRSRTVQEKGLDMSFGYTPQTFEKVNLLGSQLKDQAIESLVLSVPNITYLDLRGNFLDATFGWRLIKGMKRRHLLLEFCNGVNLRGLRDNIVETLNLSNFTGHLGLYGIEVVGAIFLAHFLRINSSLQFLCFRRNDVQKDGAKALAQSLLGNPESRLRIVNYMGPARPMGAARSDRPSETGIDFSAFRVSALQTVHLQKRMLDDDDFVFLEEFLHRYDCVTDLDISDNHICGEGVRKLVRYIKDTQSLRRLRSHGLPVDLEGTGSLARAVTENGTLEVVTLPLGPLNENPARQQLFQHLGVGLAHRENVQVFGIGQARLDDVRKNRVRELRSDRMVASWPRAEVAVYFWMVAALRPGGLERVQFGASGRPTEQYPAASGAPAELWPPLIGVVHDCRSLVQVSISVKKGYGALMMEAMRALTKCTMMRRLYLLGYAGATLKESELPQDWMSLGGAPRWLVEDRQRKLRVHWQALYGLLSMLPGLEAFNDVGLSGSLKDSPERTCLLLLQCLEGVAGEFGDSMAEPRLVCSIGKEGDVDAFCDVLRILSRTPVLVELTFTDKNMEHVKAQQLRLAGPLSGVPAGETGPRFTHPVALKNSVVSDALLASLEGGSPLKEFAYERLHPILPALHKALVERERPVLVERIRVEPKWGLSPNFMRKRFTDRQRRWLAGIKAAMVRNPNFVEVRNLALTSVTREQLAQMPDEDFAQYMTGLAVDEPHPQEEYGPMTNWRCYTSVSDYMRQDHNEEVVELPLPLDIDVKGQLQLRKLSLCMCNLRSVIARVARADEWPGPSRPLWRGPRRLIRPGDWYEYSQLPVDAIPQQAQQDGDLDGVHIRYHWRERLVLGSKATADILEASTPPETPPFSEDLLHESMRSLLADHPSLTWLDVRGNGFNKEDANLLLSLLEQYGSLVTLNMIPVTIEDAHACKVLDFDGTGASASHIDGHSHEDDYSIGEAWAEDSLSTNHVRLDEGDAFLFLSLVSAQNFPELRSVLLRRHEVPDQSLPHICDALLNLPSIDHLQLSELQLSTRGSSLLLSAAAEMASRLVSLNGVPVKRMGQMRNAPEGVSVPLDGPIEWNDFSLGVIAKQSLWPVAALPSTGSGEFPLHGRSLTDVGTRGLCAMLRYHLGAEHSMDKGNLQLSRIDLSGNSLITDASAADLCHTLQHPSTSSSLRHTLRELNLRSCPRLKARSAAELKQLTRSIRDNRDGSATLGSSLQVISGVDVAALDSAAKASAGGRAGLPPMLLRSYVDYGERRGRAHPRIELGSLSECDVHYFAGVMHSFPQIMQAHVHIVLPLEARRMKTAAMSYAAEHTVWGRQNLKFGAGAPSLLGTVRPDDLRRNDSPFPPPDASITQRRAAAIQAHIDTATRFFEACPMQAQTKFSMIPCVPGCADYLAEGDPHVLATLAPNNRGGTSPAGIFGQIQTHLQERAARRRQQKRIAQPWRPLYVNNINSQRLHDCYRTLYGQDDVELEHADIMPLEERSNVRLPSEVDITGLFAVASSIDMQHLDLRPFHLSSLEKIEEMPVLSHLNLNHNSLGDAGIELLFGALINAGSSVVHLSLSSNNIGFLGADAIACSLPHLHRLTSIELCDNFLQEDGSIVIAEAVGGALAKGPAEGVPPGPVPLLSVDLRGNRSRGLGAMRWAEMVAVHPTLQCLSLAGNEVAFFSADAFIGLVHAASAAAALSVLDLRNNFPAKKKRRRPGVPPPPDRGGPPPLLVVEGVLSDLPPGEFDSVEVRQGVFIRRRQSAQNNTSDRRAHQSQQHSHSHSHNHSHNHSQGAVSQPHHSSHHTSHHEHSHADTPEH